MELWLTIGDTNKTGSCFFGVLSTMVGAPMASCDPPAVTAKPRWDREVGWDFQEAVTSHLRPEGKGGASSCWSEGDCRERGIVWAERVASSKTWKENMRSIWCISEIERSSVMSCSIRVIVRRRAGWAGRSGRALGGQWWTLGCIFKGMVEVFK